MYHEFGVRAAELDRYRIPPSLRSPERWLGEWLHALESEKPVVIDEGTIRRRRLSLDMHSICHHACEFSGRPDCRMLCEWQLIGRDTAIWDDRMAAAALMNASTKDQLAPRALSRKPSCSIAQRRPCQQDPG